MYISYYQFNGATAGRLSKLVAIFMSVMLLTSTISPVVGASTTRRLEATAQGSMGGWQSKS